MWKFAIKSVRGSAHEINGLPCQDASDACVVGDVLICAMSDGAGSAKLSDVGSKIIVEESLRLFGEYFGKVEAPEVVVRDIGPKQGEWLIESIRDRLARVAIERNEPEQEFAGTLLVAVITKNKSVFYQVGDGLWCVGKSGILGAVTWPEQGEFASQTIFVTSSSALQSIQCVTVEGPVDFIVGMTDGLERLTVDLQGRVPFPGFCNPLIAALRKAESVDDFSGKLVTFLSSPRVCERTDDDKTLALIVHENDL